MTTRTNSNNKCLFCQLDLNTLKSFNERADKESVKFCSSKCRKADLRNNIKIKKFKTKR